VAAGFRWPRATSDDPAWRPNRFGGYGVSWWPTGFARRVAAGQTPSAAFFLFPRAGPATVRRLLTSHAADVRPPIAPANLQRVNVFFPGSSGPLSRNPATVSAHGGGRGARADFVRDRDGELKLRVGQGRRHGNGRPVAVRGPERKRRLSPSSHVGGLASDDGRVRSAGGRGDERIMSLSVIARSKATSNPLFFATLDASLRSQCDTICGATRFSTHPGRALLMISAIPLP